MTYLEVAVAAPIDHTLTYLAPEHDCPELLPGLRLLVPLAGRQVTGYLLSMATKAPTTPGRKHVIKPVVEVLDREPLFPANMVPFFRWIARYYQHPIGEVIKTALPGGLTTESGRRIVLLDAGRSHLRQYAEQSARDGDRERRWLIRLLQDDVVEPTMIRRAWRGRDRLLLQQWQRAGWIAIVTATIGDRVGARHEVCVARHDDQATGGESTAAAASLKVSEQKTLDLLAELSKQTGRVVVPRREMTRQYQGAGKALKSLAEKGLISLTTQRVYRDPFGQLPHCFPVPDRLTREQEVALDSLLPAIDQAAYAAFLLHGITGSGKTEVYLRATARVLERDRTALILVPEIALATQLEGHFISRFGDRVALLHSGLTTGERYDQWSRITRGEARVVIGARSAIFAPLPDPGLIIVDEEHDSAYKQEDGLRYQARDLAVLRASRQRAVVLMGSATPSITSYHHAQTGKYRLLTLTKRIEDRPLPSMQIINLRTIHTVSGAPPFFSSQLTRALRDNLRQGQQSLIFLNRRGYANLMLCRQCGKTIQCRQCHVGLTVHRFRNELVCHYCGDTAPRSSLCPNCRSSDLVELGFGTERLDAELNTLFPTARIARLDRDTCTTRKAFISILKKMHANEIDILIGTQMIAKGHHFPNVTLVGIVWADAGLGLPDYTASERTFQIVSQVSGRAGRGVEPGRVILQTHQPEHDAIAMAQRHDYQSLYAREIGLRKRFGFPPFSRLINLRLEGGDETEVRAAAETLADCAKAYQHGSSPLVVRGPAPAPLARLRGNYRWQVLLMGAHVESLHTACIAILRAASGRIRPRQVTILVDVDPDSML